MAGQKKLKAASVLLIGAGGLGSPLAMYLAAAGIGRIGLVDYDVVDQTNLQRQIIHGTKDVGRPKLIQRQSPHPRHQPHVQVDPTPSPSPRANALDDLREYDVIIDGTDNFPTRYLTNDACVLLGKPNVYGSIFRFEGQRRSFTPKKARATAASSPNRPRRDWSLAAPKGGVLGILPGHRSGPCRPPKRSNSSWASARI
jgi:sulfur-carrier protein adenylyltransferase/sulfurtransferase